MEETTGCSDTTFEGHSREWGRPWSRRCRLARFRLFLILGFLGVVLGPASAHAQGPYLKLRADKAAQPDKPIKLTLTAVSGRTLVLPAASVWVDEGDGLKARPDLSCALGDGSQGLTVTPDEAAVASCEIRLAKSGKHRVRLEYKLPSGLVRTNTLTLEVLPTGSAAGS